MGVSFLEIYGEKVEIVHHESKLAEHTNFYGEITFDGMNYKIYTNGYGGMKALFIG